MQKEIRTKLHESLSIYMMNVNYFGVFQAPVSQPIFVTPVFYIFKH